MWYSEMERVKKFEDIPESPTLCLVRVRTMDPIPIMDSKTRRAYPEGYIGAPFLVRCLVCRKEEYVYIKYPEGTWKHGDMHVLIWDNAPDIFLDNQTNKAKQMEPIKIKTVDDFPTEPSLCTMTVLVASTGLAEGQSGRFSFCPTLKEVTTTAWREGDTLMVRKLNSDRVDCHSASKFPNIIIFD